jgi:coenzyme Q-binding protein COQ10
MPRIAERRSLAWSARQMYDLVADVRRYPEFLPWVVATRIKSDSETEMVADMMVGFNALREKFTSRVHKHAPRDGDPGRIEVDYLDGPMKSLSNNWVFEDADNGGCTIAFTVEFSFRNALFEKIAGQYLDRAFRKMVAAFETRAERLYGNEALTSGEGA